MKKAAIVFVSDIHYTDNDKESQFLEDDANDYYQKWENCIDKECEKKGLDPKYLVISGDLVERGSIREYKVIQNILNNYCNHYGIKKENVLVIPGNHDINRDKLSVYCDENDVNNNDACRHFDIKLNAYADFYKSFKGRSVNVSDAIVDTITIDEENLCLLGLNTLAKESHLDKDHYGFVDSAKLKREIEEYDGSKCNYIVVSHHSFAETRDNEIASIKNADVVKETFGLHGITTFIYGHHHISESKRVIKGEDSFTYVEIGSLAKVLSNQNGDNYNNRFTIAICEDEKLVLSDYEYSGGEWIERNSEKYSGEINLNSSLASAGSMQIDESITLPVVNVEKQERTVINSDNDINLYEQGGFLIEYLKKDGNYKEGHFHWTNNVKTLGWINIAAFLGNYMILGKIKECITDIFDNKLTDVSAVIGYGVEGNIIGSSLVDYWLTHEIQYYSYPSVHKANEYVGHEKDLWDKYRTIKNIAILCDIMPPAYYINEIIQSNNSIRQCECITFISLFLNRNLLKNDSNVIEGVKINKYSLAQVDVQICDKDKEDCFLYKQELTKIYNL